MQCPGQDTQYWKPGAIFDAKCPQCGGGVEFFKDDTARKCSHCGHRFPNPRMDFGCAAYCAYAEQCLGTLPAEAAAQREELLKDRVAVEMKRYFKTDFRRIGQASRVARHAERIGKLEGGNLSVILPAAFLHDIGIPDAQRYNEDAVEEHHETQGQAAAREILERLGARAELVDAVCDIVGRHHHPGLTETTEFQAVYDAQRLVRMEEEQKDHPLEAERLSEWIESTLLTEAARAEARRSLLES